MKYIKRLNKRLFRLTSLALLLALVLTSAGTGVAQASDWWDTNWSYRMKLTFDNSASGENLTNFSVLVHLTSTHSDFWDHINSSITTDDTKDLRFVDADDTTELYFEAEKIAHAGQDALIWVKVPQIDAGSTTDFIYVYYGNSSASQSSYHSASDVWDSNYKMVQHLEETSGTHYDSTSNNNDGTPQNGVTQNATGKIDGADDFDGTDDWVNCGEGSGSLDFGTGDFMVEAWVKTTETNTRHIIAKSGYIYGVGQYTLQINNGKLKATLNDGTPHNLGDGSTTINNDSWHYIAVTFDRDAKATYYVNGANDKETDISAFTGSIDNSYLLRLAEDPKLMGPVYFNGIIDEVRISNIARSADWIEAQYSSMANNSQTYGSEETASSSPPSTVVGGEVYPINKLNILAPWLGLALVLSLAIGTLYLRQHQTQKVGNKEL